MPVTSPLPGHAATDPDDAIDRQLLSAIARGDRAAFAAFHARHHRRLFRFLARISGNPARVDEALNDTLFAVWTSAERFAGTARVTTWLFGIAWRQHQKAVRRDRRWIDLDDIDDVAIADPHRHDEAFEAADLAARLEAGFARLSPPQRAVVELSYFNGCDTAEIARILDCPVGTVKTRMFHARARLRALLDPPTARRPPP